MSIGFDKSQTGASNSHWSTKPDPTKSLQHTRPVDDARSSGTAVMPLSARKLISETTLCASRRQPVTRKERCFKLYFYGPLDSRTNIDNRLIGNVGEGFLHFFNGDIGDLDHGVIGSGIATRGKGANPHDTPILLNQHRH